VPWENGEKFFRVAMKFICNQSDLNNALGLVSRAVSVRPSQPILGNVLLEAMGDSLTLTGFDLAIGIRLAVPADVQADGSITVPAKLFSDIVARLGGDLTVELAADESEFLTQVIITSDSGRFEIRGLDSQEFPVLPSVEGDGILLPLAAVMAGLRGTLFASSTDETKQVLTGVHIKSVDDGLEFAATDGHRLAVVTVECDAPPDLEVTLPSRALRDLEKLAGEDGDLVFRADDTQAVFEVSDRRLTCRKLDGAYPAYWQLIPQQFSRTLTVDRRRLISGLERVAVLADQKNNLVNFSLDRDRLLLEVSGQDVGNGRDNMAAELNGTPLKIAFNLNYLLTGLKAIASQDVQLNCNEANQPVIFSPLNGDRQKYLVMPVQVPR
jgi:DNA polymerase-3 subunit beta